MQTFNVKDSSYVHIDLNSIDIFYNDPKQMNMKKVPYPHTGTRINILTVGDHKVALHYIHKQCPTDWVDLAFCWNWGHQAYICGCSAHSLVISDLHCSSALGPGKSKIMCAVLRKGNAQKEKHTNDRVVGCWRHKVWEMCGIGSLAMLLL